MKKKVLKEVKKHIKKVKKAGIPPVKITLKSGGVSSLGKVIKTQEQADLFMKILKAL